MSTEPQRPVALGRKFALLVGVNGGQPASGLAPLLYAINDAEAMAQVLQEDACGFQLFPPPLLGEQATTENVRNAIFALVDKVQEGDFALFYFSGHAMPVSGQEDNVYLVTHNFVPPLPGREQFEISFKFLREYLYEHKKAACIVIILDCCFAGMFGDSAQDPYIEDILKKLRTYFQEPGDKSPSLPGGERLVIAATGRTTASERDGNGLMTLHILQALKGEVPQAANADDQITHHLLAEYLATALSPDQKPWFLGSSHRVVLATHPGLTRRAQQSAEKQRQFKTLWETLPESDIVKKRLEGFVGRATELAEVRQMIAELLPQGGYVVITSEAGQGKSSLIAKLVESFAPEQKDFETVAYHFIPSELRSGGRHYLLSELLKRLISKYTFDLDISRIGENDLVLNEMFQQVLKEIVKQKGQEVIFIDGLDQLAIDREIGQHDLSFLPSDLATLPGIVFVLGTRPDQTLTLLKYKKPVREYRLGGLSYNDFLLLLSEYNLSSLPPSRGTYFYEKSGGHTLFLNVLVHELSSQPGLIKDNDLEEILKTINMNPEQVFELSIRRLRLQEKVWDKVSKPLLKLLMVAEEALTSSQIIQLLELASSASIDSDWLEQGFEHLGGLVVRQQYIRQGDAQERYTLKHLLLRKYLQNHFKKDQQEQHRHFVAWCKQEKPDQFWEPADDDDAKQEQRWYARHYYITHLYHAHLWETLFTILDAGEFGKGRLLEYPSGRPYTRDLSWGQQAAANMSDAVSALPHLWHYTFLRCSLTSRADNYSETTFHLLLLLGPEHEREALELAEMLTSPVRKARIFTLIASHLAASDTPERQQEATLLARNAEQMVEDLPDDTQKVDLLYKLSDVMRRTGHIQEAEQMEEQASQISHAPGLDAKGDQLAAKDFISVWQANRARNDGKAEALIATSLMLERVEYWTGNEPIWRQVTRLIRALPDTIHKARVLAEFALAEERMGHKYPAAQLRSEVIALLAAPGDEAQQEILLTRFMKTLEQVRPGPEIGKMWGDIEFIILNFSDHRRKARALIRLASSLAQVRREKAALRILSALSDEYEEIKQLISANVSMRELIRALSELARQLNGTGNEEEVDSLLQRNESMISTFSENQESVEDLITSAMELGKTGHQVEALHMLLALENIWRKIQELANLGTLCMQIGQTSHLGKIKRKVEELIQEVAGDERDMEVLATLTSLTEQEEGREQHINELIALTLDLWQKGWNLEVEQYFQKIVPIIRSIADETSRHAAWLKLVEARGRTRNWTAIEDLAEEFSPGRNKADYLALRGELLGRAGRTREAEDIIETILDQSNTVKMTDPSDATTATSILNDDSIDPIFKTIRDKALVKLAEAYWQTRSWAYAENAIQSIYDQNIKNDILAKQAEMMGWDYVMHPIHSTLPLEEHATKELEDLLANTMRVIDSLKEEVREEEEEEVRKREEEKVKWRKFQAFTRLGEIMAESNLVSEAREICEEAEAMFSVYEHAQANRILEDERESQIALFARLGIVFVRIGDRQRAEDILQEVEIDILSLFHGKNEDRALATLVDMLSQAKCWSEAREVIAAIVDQAIKEGALSNLGHFLALAQRWQEAEEIIGSIEMQKTINPALFDLTNLLIEAKLWEQAERVARSIEGTLGEQARNNLKEARNEKAWDTSQSEGGDARRILRELKREPGSRPPVLYRRAPSPVPSALPARAIARRERKVPEKVPSAPPAHATPYKERKAHEERERMRSLQKQWRKAETREQAFEYFTSICELIPDHPELGIRLWNAFKDANSFLEALASANTNIQ